MSRQKLHKKQNGIVSIMVALVLMMIMTLIALSFAFLVRRESKQSVDRQLSTAAFYAAESGVNDAVAKLKKDPTTLITDCANTAATLGYKNNLDGTNVVGYSCVLIDPAPGTVEVKNLDTDKSRVFALKTSDGSPITSIQISWQASSVGGVVGNQFAGNTSHLLPKAGTPNQQNLTTTTGTGMVRATVIPVKAPMTKDSLLSSAQNMYLYPTSNGLAGQRGNANYLGSASPNDANQGVFADGNCNAGNASGNTPLYCNVVINNIGGVNTDTVYLRLRSIYKPSDVTIMVNGGAGIAGAQAQIDATGRANDVVRRIRVRVPLANDSNMPEAAIESMDTICKRATVYTQGGVGMVSTDVPVGLDPTGACSLL